MIVGGAAEHKCNLPFTSQDGAVMEKTPGIANNAKSKRTTGASAREASMAWHLGCSV